MTRARQKPDSASPLVLVVDDDPDSRAIISRRLTTYGFRCEQLESAERLLEALSRVLPDVVCLDLGLPGLGGMDALAIVRERHQTVPVIIVTGQNSTDTAVQAIQRGAYDFVTKPIDPVVLSTAVRKAAEHYKLRRRVAELECDASGEAFPGIVGESASMRALFRQLQKVVASDITVLVHGESGTGKEMVARALHSEGGRKAGPFVAVNCAAVAESLEDSEFFGHDKGAFTGAQQTKAGRFEQANGGTLFLDEVAELSLNLQAKLLRVLQERQFQRVGGTRNLGSDFRLVAATHRDLRSMAANGQFREDLFYRIAVFELELPPLRARQGDIPLLIGKILSGLAPPEAIPTLGPRVIESLEEYRWPGNVRELRNILERALVVCSNRELRLEDLPPSLTKESATGPSGGRNAAQSASPLTLPTEPLTRSPTRQSPEPSHPSQMTMAQLERWAIESHMQRTNGDIAEVVKALGIGRTTLYRRLKEYRLDEQ